LFFSAIPCVIASSAVAGSADAGSEFRTVAEFKQRRILNLATALISKSLQSWNSGRR
jgi:hypothetical protein